MGALVTLRCYLCSSMSTGSGAQIYIIINYDLILFSDKMNHKRDIIF
jgi:hypothetical protein